MQPTGGAVIVDILRWLNIHRTVFLVVDQLNYSFRLRLVSKQNELIFVKETSNLEHDVPALDRRFLPNQSRTFVWDN